MPAYAGVVGRLTNITGTSNVTGTKPAPGTVAPGLVLHSFVSPDHMCCVLCVTGECACRVLLSLDPVAAAMIGMQSKACPHADLCTGSACFIYSRPSHTSHCYWCCTAHVPCPYSIAKRSMCPVSLTVRSLMTGATGPAVPPAKSSTTGTAATGPVVPPAKSSTTGTAATGPAATTTPHTTTGCVLSCCIRQW